MLENVRVAVEKGAVPAAAFRDAEARAAEFMLAHRLYRSDHTGEVISERFTQLTYPWHWHYTVLRALDYLRFTPAINDERLEDPIELPRAHARRTGGAETDSGTLLVEMERPGQTAAGTPCALRVLRGAYRKL